MQSGKSKNAWVLEYTSDSQSIDDVMGWSGSSDTKASEVKLRFDSQEEAVKFAKETGVQYKVMESNQRKQYIKSAYTKIFLDRKQPKCEL